jgi:hypothetical protein
VVRLMAHPYKEIAIPDGLYPLSIKPLWRIDVDRNVYELTDISCQLWLYLGYSGLIFPWHDSSKRHVLLKENRDKLEDFFWFMHDIDVDWRSYCILSFVLCDYSDWISPFKLISKKTSHWSWMRKLRAHAGSSELIDLAAQAVFQFVTLQVQQYSKAVVKTKSSVSVDVANGRITKKWGTYQTLVDRLRQLHDQKIDTSLWLAEKFKKCSELHDFVYLATIANLNGMEPDTANLVSFSSDSFAPIKKFLGLSPQCEFVDGFIPKGWCPAVDAVRPTSDIVRITADGFYYYSSGEQRKGRYHYARNKYHIIKCLPENFEFFKKDWHNPLLLTSRPTWEEYNKWALYPNMWDASGHPVNGRGASVTWRTHG